MVNNKIIQKKTRENEVLWNSLFLSSLAITIKSNNKDAEYWRKENKLSSDNKCKNRTSMSLFSSSWSFTYLLNWSSTLFWFSNCFSHIIEYSSNMRFLSQHYNSVCCVSSSFSASASAFSWSDKPAPSLPPLSKNFVNPSNVLSPVKSIICNKYKLL